MVYLEQLRFASGSLTQYLSINYASKLPASTVDDVKGKLVENIPEGV
jgi:histone acetyltransferase 1